MQFRHVPNAVRRTLAARCHWFRPGRRGKAVESESEDRPGDETGLLGQAAIVFPQGEFMENQIDHAFSDAERAAIYRTIFNRRDVRGQFLPDPVPDEVLARIMLAAHHAPSVGFMQPWNKFFLVVRSPEVKQRVHDAFAKAHAEAAMMFPEGESATPTAN